MVEGKARVAVGEVGGGGVLLQLRGQRRERVREVLQEREHLVRRKQVFHHHEAHEVQAEVTPHRGGFYRGAQPVHVGGQAGLGWLVHAAMPRWARHPLMFSFAREFTGADTAKGREMTRLWQYEGYRRVFRVITAVWGIAFLLEAALRVVIVYKTSTGTALAISKVTPFLFAAVLVAWTIAYGAHHKRKGERMAAATSEVSPAPDAKQRAAE
jgi:hypothetical protein